MPQPAPRERGRSPLGVYRPPRVIGPVEPRGAASSLPAGEQLSTPHRGLRQVPVRPSTLLEDALAGLRTLRHERGHPQCGQIRFDLGAYVLGSIGAADRNAVGAHLACCADCRDELAELAGLPGLLSRVTADEAESIACFDDGSRNLSLTD
jgi:hypothetical protein